MDVIDAHVRGNAGLDNWDIIWPAHENRRHATQQDYQHQEEEEAHIAYHAETELVAVLVAPLPALSVRVLLIVWVLLLLLCVGHFRLSLSTVLLCSVCRVCM